MVVAKQLLFTTASACANSDRPCQPITQCILSGPVVVEGAVSHHANSEREGPAHFPFPLPQLSTHATYLKPTAPSGTSGQLIDHGTQDGEYLLEAVWVGHLDAYSVFYI